MSMGVGGHLYDNRKCHDCGKVCKYPTMLWDIDISKRRIMLCTKCAKLLGSMLIALPEDKQE